MKVDRLLLVSLLLVGAVVSAPGAQRPDQTAGQWQQNQAEADRRRYFSDLVSSRNEALGIIGHFRNAYRNRRSRFNLISWGLANIYYGERHDPDRQADKTQFDLYEALEEQRFPMSVELARVLFLIGVRRHAASPWETTGERLLKLDPNDTSVLLRMVIVLNERTTEVAFSRSLLLSERLIRLRPKDSIGYLAKASAYFEKSGRTHDKNDLKQAVANYDLALKHLNPPIDKYRIQLRSLADALRKAAQG